MRYTELPWPFDGWTVDDNGVIHTASGYRVRPAQIEAWAWLMSMHNFANTMGADRLMFNEFSIEEKRPIFHWKDTEIEIPRPNDINVRGAGTARRKAPAGRPPSTLKPRRPRSPRS